MTQVLSRAPKMWFSGVHIIDKDFRDDAEHEGDGLGGLDVAALENYLRRIRHGQFMTAHMTALPGLDDVLRRQGMVHLLIIRDPRDVVVSEAFYLSRNRRLHMQKWFEDLHNDEARIMAAITGIPSRNGLRGVASIGELLEGFRPWLMHPDVTLIRFEDLVGSQGGGSDRAQRDTVARILRACGRNHSESVVREVAQAVFTRHSATFRQGRIGGWQEHFTDGHLQAMNAVAPGVVKAFGYE